MRRSAVKGRRTELNRPEPRPFRRMPEPVRPQIESSGSRFPRRRVKTPPRQALDGPRLRTRRKEGAQRGGLSGFRARYQRLAPPMENIIAFSVRSIFYYFFNFRLEYEKARKARKPPTFSTPFSRVFDQKIFRKIFEKMFWPLKIFEAPREYPPPLGTTAFGRRGARRSPVASRASPRYVEPDAPNLLIRPESDHITSRSGAAPLCSGSQDSPVKR
jgi:hypothetical protein